jgi:hypothetical protein
MKTFTIQNLLFGMALATAAALVTPTASAASPNLFASVALNGTLVNGKGVFRNPHRHGAVRGDIHVRCEQLRLCLDHATRLLAGHPELHGWRPPEQQRSVRGDQESGRRLDRRTLRSRGCLQPEGLGLCRSRLHRQSGPLVARRDADSSGRRPI